MKTPKPRDDSRSFRVPKEALTADPGFWEAASLQRAVTSLFVPSIVVTASDSLRSTGALEPTSSIPSPRRS